ncbi:hypothetical protein [Ileibacterium valens]|uniref:hypothetical protein n=1 Tax=Ileibacterium valens TaxID=1862668 RepID=UPI0025B781C4|nr:hypothetical protein [Ileibacterium valens]
MEKNSMFKKLAEFMQSESLTCQDLEAFIIFRNQKLDELESRIQSIREGTSDNQIVRRWHDSSVSNYHLTGYDPIEKLVILCPQNNHELLAAEVISSSEMIFGNYDFASPF